MSRIQYQYRGISETSAPLLLTIYTMMAAAFVWTEAGMLLENGLEI